MSADSVTLQGRALAERDMTSTCVIARAGLPLVTDANGVDSPTFTTIYTGFCRLRLSDPRSSGVEASGQSIEKQSPVLSIPVQATGSANVLPDDIATVTSPLDPSTTIKVRIAGVHSQTHSTARRFPVEVQS